MDNFQLLMKNEDLYGEQMRNLSDKVLSYYYITNRFTKNTLKSLEMHAFSIKGEL